MFTNTVARNYCYHGVDMNLDTLSSDRRERDCNDKYHSHGGYKGT